MGIKRFQIGRRMPGRYLPIVVNSPARGICATRFGDRQHGITLDPSPADYESQRGSCDQNKNHEAEDAELKPLPQPASEESRVSHLAPTLSSAVLSWGRLQCPE